MAGQQNRKKIHLDVVWGWWALIFTVICLGLAIRENITLSELTSTPYDSLFTIQIVLVGAAFRTSRDWIRCSWWIWALLVFDQEWWPRLHEIAAIGFFVQAFWIISQSKRHSSLSWMALPVLLLVGWNLLLMEVVGIVTICWYHILHLRLQQRIRRFRV